MDILYNTTTGAIVSVVEESGDFEKAMKVIAGLEASMRHAQKIEDALRGIIRHWNEFGDMMGVKDDYGFSERLDAAEKLVR